MWRKWEPLFSTLKGINCIWHLVFLGQKESKSWYVYTALFVLFCLFWSRKINSITSKWEISAHSARQKTMPNPEAHLEGPLTMVPGAEVSAPLVLGSMWRRHWDHNFGGKTSDQLDLRFPTEDAILRLLSWVYYMTEKSTSTLLRTWYLGVSWIEYFKLYP